MYGAPPHHPMMPYPGPGPYYPQPHFQQPPPSHSHGHPHPHPHPHAHLHPQHPLAPPPPPGYPPNLLQGPPGLMDASQRLHPPPPPPAQHQQQHYLAPPVHGLSSLTAAVEHGAGSSAGAGGAAAGGAGSSRGDDSPSPSRFSVSRSRSRSPGRLPASHHQISAKRKEQHRIEYARHMRQFWAKQKELIERTDYKRLKHDLPLARIKKIMKSDDEVRMISAEVPILFSKACELFILDLTMRAWAHTADTNRRTLQRSDVADAILEGEGMDFLVDIVPRDEEAAAAAVPAAGAVVTETGEPASGVVASANVGMDTEKLLKLLDQEMNGDKRAQGMRDGAATAAAPAGSAASSGNGKIEAVKRQEEEYAASK